MLHGLHYCMVSRVWPLCIQGYIQYRIAGEPHRLDVDTLNEKLRLRGAARMRLLMRPDEAYGMVFDFDGQHLTPAGSVHGVPACMAEGACSLNLAQASCGWPEGVFMHGVVMPGFVV